MTDFPQLDGFRGAPGVVRLIGHRGARGVMPENTMEGFAFTLKVGVRAMEFDVVLTRDRTPIITHNHHLLNAATRGSDGNWLTGAELKVSDLSLTEVKQFDVGGLDGSTVYGKRFPDQVFMSGVQVPCLAELLDFALQPEGRDLLLLLEMKSEPALPDQRGNPLEIVHEVIEEVRSRGLEQRTILHSFDWSLLEECARLACDIPRSYLSQLPENDDDPGEDSQKSVAPDFDVLGVSIPQAVANAGGSLWCPYFMDVTPELVAEAHELGLLVETWTVNETDDINAMIDAGVDGIITDYPGRAQRILLSRGLTW
ncbi:glycerophosphodiester phosphodiesterase family protein [Pacificoceanicola onchidii]|uniref:glycerophosphodiester phosphodiesterase family protein n=1 Tax=Pacificoceanicola onchidii TaxID=2562685 RepID=UPI0010A5E120|nr:glycerophosphodiester phosphodiesterase family protein [Pacificoceanicola onchidii]